MDIGELWIKMQSQIKEYERKVIEDAFQFIYSEMDENDIKAVGKERLGKFKESYISKGGFGGKP